MNHFTASTPPIPADMPLRARLAWIFFFSPEIPQLEERCGGWSAVKTDSGSWIITDEASDLDTAMVFPDEDDFVSWLEETASSHLEADPVAFLQNFTSVRDLITPEIAQFIVEKALS